MGRRGFGCGFDLPYPGGIRAAVGDVLANGTAEQHRLLQNDADALSQAFQRHIAHVVAVDQHLTFADVGRNAESD